MTACKSNGLRGFSALLRGFVPCFQPHRPAERSYDPLLCDEQQRNARAWSRVASSMRRVVLLLLVACPLFAKPFDVEADLSRLTDAQREWLLTFEAGARLHANVEIPSSDWLRASASSAREVELGETANVLDAAADVLTNRRATFPATWDSPVYVMPFVIEGKLTDVVVAVPNPRFERSDRARIATLQFRAGASAASTAVDSKFGTMSIVYDNMAGAAWFSARVLPVAEALMPSAAMH